MMNIRLSRTALLALIIAFISVQWSTTHIHLTEHLHHEGHHHLDAKVHSHQSIDNHTVAADLSHQANALKTIDLDHEFNAKKIDKLEKPSTLALLQTIPDLTFILVDVTKLPTNTDTRLRYHYLSSIRPRAPPAFS